MSESLSHGTLRLEIVTPEKTAYSEDVEMVTLPGLGR